jgi:hypothetical protein
MIVRNNDPLLSRLATRESIFIGTGSILSLVLLEGEGGGDVTRAWGVDRAKGGGRAPPLHPHQAGPKIPP